MSTSSFDDDIDFLLLTQSRYLDFIEEQNSVSAFVEEVFDQVPLGPSVDTN